MANHPIVHLEISANDPQAAGKFYSELFDWKLELDPNFNYLQFEAPPGPGGAFVQVGGESGTKPGDVTVYFGTDDIEASLSKVESLGGKTIMPKTEIPGVGWFAMFTDPTGNKLALYTSIHQ